MQEHTIASLFLNTTVEPKEKIRGRGKGRRRGKGQRRGQLQGSDDDVIAARMQEALAQVFTGYNNSNLPYSRKIWWRSVASIVDEAYTSG